jgi:hypothetical protein
VGPPRPLARIRTFARLRRADFREREAALNSTRARLIPAVADLFPRLASPRTARDGGAARRAGGWVALRSRAPGSSGSSADREPRSTRLIKVPRADGLTHKASESSSLVGCEGRARPG